MKRIKFQLPQLPINKVTDLLYFREISNRMFLGNCYFRCNLMIGKYQNSLWCPLFVCLFFILFLFFVRQEAQIDT